MSNIWGCILCVGDSLTFGSRDEFSRGYPFYLSEILSERFEQNWICVNEGVPGETSSGLVNRIYGVLKKYPEAYEVVIQTGTNDGKPIVDTPPRVFEQNIDQIIRCLEIFKKRYYFWKIPKLLGFGAPDYTKWTQTMIKEYNDILQNRIGLDLIDFDKVLKKEHYADGVHLNSFGYHVVAQKVAFQL